VAAGDEVTMGAPRLLWRGSPVQFSAMPAEGNLDVLPPNAERLTEELRVIKRRLLGMQRSANKPRGNIFMVASALPGDGKSFTYNFGGKSYKYDTATHEAAVTGVAVRRRGPLRFLRCSAVSLARGQPALPRSPLSSSRKQLGRGLFRQLNRGERLAYGLSCPARPGQPPGPG